VDGVEQWVRIAWMRCARRLFKRQQNTRFAPLHSLGGMNEWSAGVPPPEHDFPPDGLR
jgi:hypothetical protein